MKKVKEFFWKLDEELNKVNQFYKSKEREFVERGEILNKQLQILLDLKQILHNRRRRDLQSKSNSPTFSRSNSSSRSSDSGLSSVRVQFSKQKMEVMKNKQVRGSIRP